MIEYLVIEDDGGVDGASHQGVAQGVKVLLEGGGRVADGDPHVDEAGELLLETLDDIVKSDNGLDLNLVLLLVDINMLEFSCIILHLSLADPDELRLVLLDGVPGDVAELSVLADLVGRPGAQRLAVDIDHGLLSQVEPDDLAVLGVDGSAHLLQALLESLSCGLATEVDLVSGDPPEVGASGNRLRQLLDLLKMVSHGHGLPYLGIVTHPKYTLHLKSLSPVCSHLRQDRGSCGPAS